MKEKEKPISVGNSLMSAIKLLGSRLQNVIRIPTKSPTPSTHQCSFPTLVDDVLIQITGHLSSPDIWALTLVSRRYNAVATPFLYSDIRLLLIPDTLSREEDRLDKKRVRKRQKRLRETLAAHTNFMLHVKTLAWHLDSLESVSDFIKFIAPMARLQTLHILRSYKSFGKRSSLAQIPSILAPACTRVIIEGLFNLEFIQHVMRPNQLKELTVDTASYQAAPVFGWIVTNSFPHLTHLCLRGPGGLWIPDADDTELVRNWKKLLFAVRAVLEEVTIGVRMAWQCNRSTNVMRAQPPTRKLIRILWPVFLYSEFPRLRTLTLTGVKIGTGKSYSIPPRNMLQIRNAVPSVVLVDDTPPSDKLWKCMYHRLEIEEVLVGGRYYRPPIHQHF